MSVEWKKLDRYGRTLGKVTADGTDCGLLQIQSGLAWHYKAYAKEQSREDKALYAQAEVVAQEQKKGLWVDREPVAPWDFRHKK